MSARLAELYGAGLAVRGRERIHIAFEIAVRLGGELHFRHVIFAQILLRLLRRLLARHLFTLQRVRLGVLQAVAERPVVDQRRILHRAVLDSVDDVAERVVLADRLDEIVAVLTHAVAHRREPSAQLERRLVKVVQRLVVLVRQRLLAVYLLDDVFCKILQLIAKLDRRFKLIFVPDERAQTLPRKLGVDCGVQHEFRLHRVCRGDLHLGQIGLDVEHAVEQLEIRRPIVVLGVDARVSRPRHIHRKQRRQHDSRDRKKDARRDGDLIFFPARVRILHFYLTWQSCGCRSKA